MNFILKPIKTLASVLLGNATEIERRMCYGKICNPRATRGINVTSSPLQKKAQGFILFYYCRHQCNQPTAEKNVNQFSFCGCCGKLKY